MRMTRSFVCWRGRRRAGARAQRAAGAAPGADQHAAVAIDNDDIGGVVTGPKGPEAGVWVIAETRDLPTRYAKMVVTDDQGRYVVPDLPKAKYKVWVRGYGLVDSPKLDAEPGQQLNLKAVAGAERGRGGEVLSGDLLVLDAEDSAGQSDFGGSSDIPAKVTFTDWLNTMKNNGCIGCHQLGQLSTRTLPKAFGTIATPSRRGCAACRPASPASRWSPAGGPARQRAVQVLRATGPTASPRANCRTSKPVRPQGVERNIVVTTWDWGTAEAVPPRPDRVRPALPDGQRLRPGVRLARILDRRVADPRSGQAHGDLLQGAGGDEDTTVALGPGHAASDTPCSRRRTGARS